MLCRIASDDSDCMDDLSSDNTFQRILDAALTTAIGSTRTNSRLSQN